MNVSLSTCNKLFYNPCMGDVLLWVDFLLELWCDFLLLKNVTASSLDIVEIT